MFAEILTELNMRQSEDFRQETREEITSIKEEMKKRDDKWEEKSNNLENKLADEIQKTNEELETIRGKIQMLEDQEEQRAKRERRNNIVIKSIDIVPDIENRDSIETKAREILNQIDAEVMAEKAIYIGKDKQNRGIVRVTFDKFEDKLKIVKNKAKLRGQDTYIDSDLTKGEREIQNSLRQRAREERAKGDTEVRVGYQKIWLRGQWVSWNDLNTKNEERSNAMSKNGERSNVM